VQGDLVLTALAGASVAFVVGLQTGSWVVAIVGVLGVAWSYPCALVLYHGVLGIKISPQLNLLVSSFRLNHASSGVLEVIWTLWDFFLAGFEFAFVIALFITSS